VNKTKICHITSAHPWNDVRIFHKECKSLANNGFDLTLLSLKGESQLIDEVNICGLNINNFSRTSRFTKAPSIILKKALEINAEIYHIHDPELLRIVFKLKSAGKKVVYDAHEDLPRQIMSKPYIPAFARRLIAAIIEYYENKKARLCDGIVTATPFINERFIKINPKSVNINNYPLNSEIEFTDSDQIKDNTVCYIGNISEIRGIPQLIEAMSYTDVKLNMAGDLSSELKNKFEKISGWEKVNVLGFIDREKALHIKKKAIAGIVTFLPVPNHVNAQPNKIFEYMASGLPVIGSDFPLWKEIIEKGNCGICVNPAAPKEIAEAINYLKNNPEKAQQMGENGKKAVVEKFNWKHEEALLIDFYHNLQI